MSELRLGEPQPDRSEFARLAGALRPALKLHCYRMLGSLQDSEDAVQETFANAWAAIDDFAGRASLKAWLYRIATNVCLNLIKARNRRRRYLPEQIGSPAEGRPGAPIAPDFPWLQPYPDAEIDAVADPQPGPLARYEARESVKLAFVAAVQRLPPRQRVALLFVDVMGWTVAEVAMVLGTSNAAINSALQRARETMGARRDGRVRATVAPDERRLVERYVRAWENRDLDGFVDLLREDAIFAMPPRPEWYVGRDSIRRFFAGIWPAYGEFRLIATHANGGPAFGLYAAGRPHSLQVLTLSGGRIATLHAFLQPTSDALFPRFGLEMGLQSRGTGRSSSVAPA